MAINFYYRAQTAEGEELTGEREADNKFALARTLRNEGLLVILVRPASFSRRDGLFNRFGLSFRRVKLKDKIIFSSNLSAMLSAGLSLSRALSVLGRQTENKYFRQVISKVEKKIDQGENLSRALANYPKVFPEVFVAMVETAEESGKLPEALKLVAGQLEKSYGLRRKIIGALIYPAVIVVVIIVIGILMMIFLIPTLSATFRELDVPLPLTTQIVIGLSDFVVNHLLLLILFVVGFVGFAVAFFRSERGQNWISRFLLFLPFFNNLTRGANSATVLRTISSLVSAGVSMTRALEITARVVQNYYYRQALIEAGLKVQKGLPLSTVFISHPHLFPVFAGEMTAVGEETGRLSDLLLKGAEFFEEEVDQVTKNLSTVVEPVLMVFIGLAVGFFAISMIGPMYSLSNAIQ